MVGIRVVEAAVSDQAVWKWRSGIFWLRLFLSVLLAPSLSFTACMAIISYKPAGEWLGWSLISGAIGSGFMIVLGAPLILIFSYYRITGFLPFSIGGGICAAVACFILSNRSDTSMNLMFAVVGLIAGYLFRLMLFGLKRS